MRTENEGTKRNPKLFCSRGRSTLFFVLDYFLSSWFLILNCIVMLFCLWLCIGTVNSKDEGLFPWSFFVFALLFSHNVVPDSFVTPTDCSLPGSSCPWDFYGQEYWNGLPFPSPEDFPDPGIELASPTLAGGFFTNGP